MTDQATSRQGSTSFVVTRHNTTEVLDPPILDIQDVWLASQPRLNSSALMSVAMGPTFSYPIVIEERQKGVPSCVKPPKEVTKAFAYSGAFIARSGMEHGSSQTIWQDCKRHLQDMATIWDAFVLACPERALLSDPYLRVPGSTVFVTQGDSNEQFNGKFSESYVRLVNVILSKLQEACIWWVGQASTSASAKGKAKALPDIVLPLPADPSIQVQITSYRKALNTDAVSLPTLSALHGKAEPDFAVVCHKDVIATIQSKPELKAKEAGVLVQDRADPCGTARGSRQHGPASWWGRVIFQITSQTLAAKVSTGLLVGDWERMLLPYDVQSKHIEEAPQEPRSTRRRKSKTAGSRQESNASKLPQAEGTGSSRQNLSVVFSSKVSYCDAQRHEALAVAQKEGEEGLDGKSAGKLEFASLPNTAMLIVAWALRSYALHAARCPPAELEKAPQAPPAGADRRDESDSGEPSPKRGREDQDGGGGEASSGRASQSPQDDAASFRAPAAGTGGRRRHAVPPSLPNAVPPCLTTYFAGAYPLKGGTFATLHSCFVNSEYLAIGSPSFWQGSREVLGGRMGFPSSKVPPGETAAMLKIQRLPFTDQEPGVPPAPRFEVGEDAQRPNREERRDIQQRTKREVSAFQHCSDLQGVYIPKLYGLVSPRNEPVSSADKLMMQYIDGQPLGATHAGLIYLWRTEILAGIRDAFLALHSRGLLHGDVSSNNVMVEWKDSQDLNVPPSESKAVHGYIVRTEVQEALEQMGTHDTSLGPIYTSESSDIMYAGCRRAVRTRDIPAGARWLPSPLERVRASYTPRIWVVDFADSKICKAGRGEKAIALEDKKVRKELIDHVEKTVQNMAQQETNPYSFAEANWKRAVAEAGKGAEAAAGEEKNDN